MPEFGFSQCPDRPTAVSAPRVMLVSSIAAAALVAAPGSAHADNSRLNKAIVQMVTIIQYRAGCPDSIRINPQLESAARRHTVDILNHRGLDGATGSDGSSPQDRAVAAGYHGIVEETVAINPALAISGVEVARQWYANPSYYATMENCASQDIGVWSENSLDRTVVVAVYGQPE